MYYIRSCIEIYGLYLLYIPLFIFYISYFSFMINFLYLFFSNNKFVIYYPNSTDYFIVNILWIYPNRLCFNIFYSKIKYKDKYIYIIIMLIINIIIGYPIFIFKIIYYIIKYKSFDSCWYHLSPNENKLILYINGTYIRNKKPYEFIENIKYFNELNNNVNIKFEKMFIRTGNSVHLVIFNKNTGIGTSHTTKINYIKEKNLEYVGTYLNGDKKTYMNVIENVNEKIDNNVFEISNKDINKLINEKLLELYAIKALIIRYDITNIDHITEMNKIGGIDSVTKAINYFDSFMTVYNDGIELFNKLNKCNPEDVNDILIKNKEKYMKIYEMKELLKDGEYYNKLKELINSIYELIN